MELGDRLGAPPDDAFRDVCTQVKRMLIRKICSEIMDSDRRAQAILTTCIDVIVSVTLHDEELFNDVMCSIAAERAERGNSSPLTAE
jgi:hypothetical protein